MFGIKGLRCRIESLERAVENLKQDKLCAAGVHKWQAHDLDATKPYVRCSHCYKTPQVKSS